jgi:hypothetical protein
LPLLTLILTGLNFSGIFVNSLYLVAIFLQWVIFILYSKTIFKFDKRFENQAKRLSRYANMLQQIEVKSFQSNYLISLKEKLSSKGKTASTGQLQLQLSGMDNS